jgi:3-oxoacyl-[acyl-carrier protein] reductase
MRDNRVVVVTGGASGIGKATAIRFSEAGAKVVVLDVNQEQGQAVVKALGQDAAFEAVNVANRAEVGQVMDGVVARYGRIDVLVNNAGITRDAQFMKLQENGEILKQMSEADFDLVVSINLKGVFNCTQAVTPHMIRQGSGGVVLNASSAVALYGNFGQTNYVATKAGVIGMTKVWARELGRYGIRVCAVAPGFTATEMVAKIPEKVLEQMKARIPLGKLAEPSDIANAYFFLASDQARHITGAVLSVDGGLVLGT